DEDYNIKMEAMKKELYEEYLNLEVIGIIWNNILVDEFDLKWNDINNGQWAKI
ncbi:1984_t:CDS:1, partial [Rhizophagus irregularis]